MPALLVEVSVGEADEAVAEGDADQGVREKGDEIPHAAVAVVIVLQVDREEEVEEVDEDRRDYLLGEVEEEHEPLAPRLLEVAFDL